jgi:hypothetical protein
MIGNCLIVAIIVAQDTHSLTHSLALTHGESLTLPFTTSTVCIGSHISASLRVLCGV